MDIDAVHERLDKFAAVALDVPRHAEAICGFSVTTHDLSPNPNNSPDVMAVSPIGFAVTQRVLADDELLNVYRALDDLIGLGIAIIAFHGKLRRVTVGAKNF